MTVIINPGTGPIPDATLTQAFLCAEQLVADIADKEVRPSAQPFVSGAKYSRAPFRDADGRYGFTFRAGDFSAVVDIPGIPVDRVRYLKLDGQNIWNYPRLYINESSFVWYYVVGLLRAELSGTVDR